jgi:hypothetical protein
MKKRSYLTCLLLAASVSVPVLPGPVAPAHAADAKSDKSAYDPAHHYTGPFDSQKLYYHLKDSPRQRSLPGGFDVSPFPETAACPEALQQLRTKGFWKGGLRADGSCAAEVPAYDWAEGNWLNFRKSNRSR